VVGGEVGAGTGDGVGAGTGGGVGAGVINAMDTAAVRVDVLREVTERTTSNPEPPKFVKVYDPPTSSFASSKDGAYPVPSPACSTSVTLFPASFVPLLIPVCELKVA